jgi:hypothetical protein
LTLAKRVILEWTSSSAKPSSSDSTVYDTANSRVGLARTSFTDATTY